MSRENESAAPHLVRALKLRDLVLFNLVAVLGLRHLATSAKAGPASLVLWALAALLFFVPQGLAVIELSSRFPDEGGIYSWTKRAFGEGHGFLCGWCYWINNVLYYPNLLISSAVVATYAIGKGDTDLKDNLTYVVITTLVALWVAVALNIVGTGTGKWLQNAGGVGTYIPGLLVILFGAYAFFTHAPANVITAENLEPNLGDYDSLNLWASIAFAFAGLELSATMGGEVENPRRNLPLSVYVSAPLIALAYLLGTGAVLWLVPGNDLNVVSGFLQAINNGAALIGPGWWWVGPLAAMLFTLGNIGGVGAWLVGPARVAFVVGLDRYFPPAFGRVHSRWQTPYVAILVQAVLATVFLLLSISGGKVGVSQIYLILLATQVLIYFIPYIYLFVCFLIHRRRESITAGVMAAPGGTVGAYVVGLSGLLITLFAMGLAMVPPPGTVDKLDYELKTVGGAAGFVLAGGIIYWVAKRKK